MKRFLCSVVTLSAWFLVAAPAGAQPVLVKMATLVPEGSSWHLILRETAEKWRTLSNNRVTVRLYPGGVAGDDADVVRKMRLGTLNAAVLTEVGVGEIEPSVYALGVPMLYDSYEELDYVLQKMRSGLEAKIEAKGFVILNWIDGGWNRFFTQKPVATPDELKTLKFFTVQGDPQSVEIYKGAGFNPIPLPTTELSTALQTGLVSAFQAPPQVAVITQYFTHAKNMTDVRWLLLLGATVISKSAWDKLPVDLRPALLQATRDAGGRLQAEIRGNEARDIDAMKKRGLTVVPVDAKTKEQWRKVAESVYSKIRGPVVPADAFDEALRYRDEYRRLHAAGR